MRKGGFFVGVLLLIGVAVVGLALYVTDRLLKARRRGLRRREMNDRLAAVAVRVTEQQEQRQAEEKASAALTSFMPAIQRPPSSLPGVHHAARQRAGRERGKADRDRRAGRRGPRSGEHPVRSAEHPVRPAEHPVRAAEHPVRPAEHPCRPDSALAGQQNSGPHQRPGAAAS